MSKIEFFVTNCGEAITNQPEKKPMLSDDQKAIREFREMLDANGGDVRGFILKELNNHAGRPTSREALRMIPPDVGAYIRANRDLGKARELQRHEMADRPRPFMPVSYPNEAPLTVNSKSRGMIPPDVGAYIRAKNGGQ